MLVRAVIVAGDGTGADVHALADGGVADIGQMRHLAAAPDGGLLNLHVGAGLGALAQVRGRAQVGARTGGGTVVDLRLHSHRLVDDATRADARVGQAAVRAHHGILADGGGAHEDDVGKQLNIGGDFHLGADIGRGRVPQGDAGGHMGLVNAALHDATGLGQLSAGVHAQALLGVVGLVGEHRPARLAGDGQHIGEVEFALGVVRVHLGQGLEEGGGIEAVEAGVALGDGGLLGRGVLLLHDAGHLAGPVAHDAAVTEGVRKLHGERVLGRQHCVGRATLSLLHHHVRVAFNQRDHLLALMPHHGDDAVGTSGLGSLHSPAHERAAQHLVDHLRLLRLHAGARPRSQDNRSSFHATPFYSHLRPVGAHFQLDQYSARPL